jgi:O-antigen ligase
LAAHQLFNFDQSLDAYPLPITRWPLITFNKRATMEAVIALSVVFGYLLIVLSVINSQKRLRLMINGLMAIGFIIAVLLTLNRFSSNQGDLLGGQWPLGFNFWELVYPGFLEMIFPLPLAMIVGGGARRDQSLLYGFAAVAICVALVTSRSSASAFVIVLEFVALGLLIVKQRRSLAGVGSAPLGKGWLVVGMVAIIGAIFAGVIWTATRPVTQVIATDVADELRGLSALQGDVSDRVQLSRVVIWRTTLNLIADYPWLGVGLGAFPTAYTRYDPAGGFLEVNAVHNDYLQLLSETGVVGGLLGVLFLVFLVRLSMQTLKSRASLSRSVALGATVGCFGILIHSLVDFYLQSIMNALLFFVLIALLLTIQRWEQTSPHREAHRKPAFSR